MYYHIIVETNEKSDKNKQFRKLYNFDNSNLEKVRSDFIIPYLKKEYLRVYWNSLLPEEDIRSISVKQTELPIGTVRHMKQRSTPSESKKIWSREAIVEMDGLTRDITFKLFQAVKVGSNPAPGQT